MDSGNSGGSLQSSSGGDEEYDSRAAALMPSLHHNHNHHHAPPQAPPPLNHTNTTPSSSIFDSLSNYFDHPISRPPPQQQQNPNSSFLNLETTTNPWPNTTLRSNPNPNIIFPSSIQQQQQQQQQQFPSVSVPSSIQENTTVPDQNNQSNQAQVVRNPKKRSRASRRAPTTVLTTDTTNFRAMVQEFTGIPAPPFTSSSPFQRPRIDLYSTSPAANMRSNNNSSLLDSSSQLQPPPYLRRPFPQKLVSSSPSAPSLLVDHAAIASPNSTSSPNNNNNNNNPTFHLPLSQSANLNLFNLQNPILTSLLQSTHVNLPKYQPSNCGIIGSKTAQSLNEFGLSHVNTASLSGLPGLISSDQTTRNDNNNPVNWPSSASAVEGNQSLARSVNNGGGNGNKLMSYNSGGGGSSGFHGEKGSSENVAVAAPGGVRGPEGMMESWICSSE